MRKLTHLLQRTTKAFTQFISSHARIFSVVLLTSVAIWAYNQETIQKAYKGINSAGQKMAARSTPQSYLNESDNMADVAKDMFGSSFNLMTTNETMSSGSLIINMSVEPQTEANALKPYGMIFDLIKNHGVTVKWVINPSKSSDKNAGLDDVDFSYNGTDYRSGAFVIPAELRTAEVNATITNWINKGVITTTTTLPLTVPVFIDLNNAPNWTLDAANGGKVLPGLEAAEIPEFNDPGETDENYIFKPTDQLDCCDYLYIMPHADPEWETHSNLYSWTQAKPTGCRGWVWSACHAVSALENAFDYINPDSADNQLNFLIEKSGVADPDNDPWAENSAVLWGDHDGGDEDYYYDSTYLADPFMQFMGKLDGAQENGSEQIYMPYSNTDWRSSTSVAIYDDNHPDVQAGEIAEGKKAAKLAYGPAYGVGMKSDYTSGNGWVMYEAGHSISGDEPQFVAAFRAFFNFSFMAAIDRGAEVDYIQQPPDTILAGSLITLKASASESQANYEFDWTMSTGQGTFGGNPASAGEGVVATVTYTAPMTDAVINGIITLTVRDNCLAQNVKRINTNVVIKPPPPVAPICTSPTLSTPPNAELEIPLTTLITDTNTDTSGFSIITQPTNGTVSLSSAAVATYLPDFNSSVSDSYVYQVCDLDGLCCTGTVTINIECPTDGTTSKIFGTAFYDGNKDNIINSDDYGYPGGAKVRLYQDYGTIGTLDGADIELTDFSPDTTNSIGGYSFSLFPSPAVDDTLNIPIAVAADDVEQKRSAFIDGETEFDMGGSNEDYVGMRFQNINIPQGTPITSAYIQFTSSQKDKTIIGVKIGIHDTDNSPALVNSPGGYLSAIYNDSTIPTVTDTMVTAGSNDQPYNSMELSSLVSGVIGKATWSSANPITFIIDNRASTEDAAGTYYQDEGTAAFRPILYIDTSSGPMAYPMLSTTDDAHHSPGDAEISDVSEFHLEPHDDYTFQGFLFKNVTIPSGVTINSAVLTLTTSNAKTSTVVNGIKIGVQDIADASDLGTVEYYLSDLYHNSSIPPVTGSVTYPSLSGVSYSTFDLSSLLSSVTTKPSWEDGNNILFIMNIEDSDDPNDSKFHGYNGNMNDPKLTITYTIPAISPSGDFIVAIDTSLFGMGEDPTPLATPIVTHSINLTGTGDSDCYNDFGITIPNIPPLANNVSNPALTSCAGNSVVLPLNGQDPDGTIDMYKVTVMPSSGTLYHGATAVVVNTAFSSADTLKYTPDIMMTGEITFRYVAIDNESVESDTATYTFVISNCSPETLDDTNADIFSNSSEAPLTELLSGTDDDGTIVSYEIVTIPAAQEGNLFFMGIPVSPGQIIDAADVDELSFAPSGSFLGFATFRFAAIDDDGEHDVTPATYTIPIINSKPLAVDVTNPVHILDTGAVKLITPLLGTDADGSVEKYVIKTLPSALGGVLIQGTAISVDDTLTAAEATMITFDPTPGYSGEVSFTYESVDDKGAISASTGTYTIKITTAPVAMDVNNDIILVLDAAEPIDSLNASDDQGIEDYFFCEIPNDSLGTIYFLRNGTDTMFLIANDPMTNAEMKTLWFEPAATDVVFDMHLTYAVQDSCGFVAKADYSIPYKKFEISVAKAVEGSPIKDASTGFYKVTYKYILKNEGNEDLDSLSLTDDFSSQFGAAYKGLSTVPPTITLVGPSGTGSVDTTFTGSGMKTELLDRSGKLESGDTLAVSVEVLLDPDAGSGLLKNQAIAMGVPVDSLGNKFKDENGDNYGFVGDVSDSGTDPSGVNDGSLEAVPGSQSDSTVLYIPEISVTKSITESKLHVNGNVEVTFNFEVQNTGNTWLTNLSLEDSLYFTALSASITINNVDATSPPPKNGSYDGNGNNDLFSGSTADTLKNGQSFTVELVAEFAPENLASVSPAENQAVAGGDVIDEDGPIAGFNGITDLSDDATDIIGGGDPATSNIGALGDTGGFDDPSPLSVPIISSAKEVSLIEEASSGNDGNADVTFELKINNLGADTLENISLIDSMFSQMGGVGGGFVSVVTAPSIVIAKSAAAVLPSANGSFGPDAQANLLVGTDGVLAPGDSVTISVEVELDPNGTTTPIPLTNQATTSGSSTLSGTTVRDSTDSGSDPSTTNPGEPGDSGGLDDPTSVTISRIGLAKQMINTELSGDNYSVTFRLTLKNIGNDTITSITLVDDLVDEFGATFVDFDSTTVMINTTGVTGTPPTYNTNYNGGQGVSDSIYTSGSGGSLAPNDVLSVDLTVIINPNAADVMLPQDLTNQAKITAEDSNGSTISDLSDSGADPDGNNEGESGDTGTDNDPTPLPAIGVAKETGMITGPDGSGFYDVNFDFNIKNTGTDTLELTGLTDDLNDQIGSAFVSLVSTSSPTTNSTISPVITVNPAYDGGVTNDSIFAFSQTIKLAPSDTIGFQMIIKIDPAKADTALGNQAMAMGVGQSGFLITDSSDSGMSPNGSNENGAGDTGGSSDPSPIVIPSIGLTKTITSIDDTPMSGTIGNYDLTFRFSLENTGTVHLSNPNLVEDLKTQLGDAFVSIVSAPNIIYSDAFQASTVNVAYTGESPNDSIFNNSSMGFLYPADSVVFEMILEIDPNGGPQPLDNQASVVAAAVDADNNPLKDENGDEIVASDLSDSGTDTRGLNAGDDDDMGTKDDPTRIIIPLISSTKSIVSAVHDINTGNYDITFEIKTVNIGSDTLENILITDDIATQFGNAFVSITAGDLSIVTEDVQTTGTLSTTFNGSTNDTLYYGATVASNDSVVIRLIVEIDPDASGAPGPLLNTAQVGGLGSQSGETVTDNSDAASQPNANVEGANPDGPGDTGGIDDPLEIVIPQISATMAIEEVRVVSDSGVADHADVVFEVIVANIGNDTLLSVQFENDIKALFGDAFVMVYVDSTSIVSEQSQLAAGLNTAYNGDTNDSLFTTEPTFAPGDSIVLRYVVEVDPGENGLREPLLNQGAATGDGEKSMMVVSDLTDAATPLTADVMGTNPDGPGDTGGVDDPLEVMIPILGTTLSIVDVMHPPASDNYSHVDATMEIVVQSIGNDTVEGVQLIQELMDQLGAAFVDVVPGTITIVSQQGEVLAVANANFDGENNDSLFTTLPTLANGDSVVIRFVVELDPNADGAPVPLTSQVEASGMGTGSGLPAEDLSDAATSADADPYGDNPGAPGDTPGTPGGIDDPLEIVIPQISTTMAIEEVRVVSESGVADHADVVFEVIVANIGNDTLLDVQFENDIKALFGDAFVMIYVDSTSIVSEQSQLAAGLNTAYNGDANDSLFTTEPTFAPGDSIVLRYIVEVDPGENGLREPLLNQGTASGTGEKSGTDVDDLTDAATPLDANVMGTNPDGPGDTGKEDDPLEVMIPILGTTLSIVDVMHPPASDNYSHVDATMEIVVQSIGNDTVEGVQLIQELMDQLGAAFVDVVPGTITIVSQQGEVLAVANANFDGENNDSLFTTLPTLANGDSVVIRFVVELDPNADGAPVPLTSQVEASGTGTGSGLPAEDLSDAATSADADPYGDNPGAPGDTPGTPGGIDDPLEIVIPQISTTMAIEEVRVVSESGVADHADVVFEVIVANIGNDTLLDVQFENDIKALFGDAFVMVYVDSTSIVSEQSQLAAGLNTSYNGDANDSLFTSGPTFAPGDSIVLRYVVEVDPGENGLREPLLNQGTATGTGEKSGTDVEDLTDAATPLDADVMGTNPDGPGDTGGEDDPLEVMIPILGTTLSIVDIMHPPASEDYSHVDATMEIIVQSIGNDTVEGVQLIQELMDQLGAAFVDVVPGTITIISQQGEVLAVANANFDGEDNDSLFTTLPTLANGDSVVIRFDVELDPNADGAPVPLTSQVAASGTGTDSGLPVDDLSDAATAADPDPYGTGPDGPGDTGGIDDPLEIVIPQISTTMSIEEVRVVSDSGVADHADVVFEVIVSNMGNDTLTDVQFINDISAAFGDAFVMVYADSTGIVSQQSQLAAVVNSSYNGDTNDSLYSTLPTLAPGDSVVMRYIVEVDPGENGLREPLYNQGEAMGDGVKSMMTVTDDTDAATPFDADVMGTNPDGPGNSGGEDDPIEVLIPILGTTLSVVDITYPPASDNYSHVDATVEIMVKSIGNDTVENVQLVQELLDQLGSTFVDVVPGTITIVSQQGEVLAVANPNFDGEDNDSLFTTLPTLANGDSVVIRFDVELDPNADGAPVPLTSQVEASGMGTGSGLPVEDLSDAATAGTEDPSGDNPGAPGDTPGEMGNPGGIDDPLEIHIPQISTTMAIEEVRVVSDSGVADHADVVFEVIVANIGNDTLLGVQFENDIKALFGDAFVMVYVDSTSIVSEQSQLAAGLNTAYNGDTNDSLFTTQPTFAPGDSIVLRYVVEVDPGENGLREPLQNQGTATGDGEKSMMMVSDLTDAATPLDADVMSTNPDGPGDTGGVDDPLEVMIPILGTTLSIVDVMYPPASGNYSHVDATMEIIIQSIGNDTVEGVQLIQELMDQLGAAFVDVVPGTITIVSQQGEVLAVVNTAFDGENNDSLFTTLPTLANGDSVVIRFDVELDPNADGVPAPLTSQVEASGIGAGSLLPVEDLSDAAASADPDPYGNNTDGPGDTGGIDDPLEIYIPMLGLTKNIFSIDNPSDNGGEDAIDLTFEFEIQNIGNDIIHQIQLVDDIATQVGDAFIQHIGTPQIVDENALLPPGINIAYTGSNNDTLFITQASLEPNQSIRVHVEVQLQPLITETSLNFTNQALVVGVSQHGSLPVNDPDEVVYTYNQKAKAYTPNPAFNVAALSDPGGGTESSNPEAPEDMGTSQDPTASRIPLIGLTKEIVGVEEAVSNVVGNFDVTYQMIYRNNGNVDLKNIQIEDDMESQLFDAFVRVVEPSELSGISTNPRIVESGADIDPIVSLKYEGVAPFINMFDANTGLLRPDSQIVIQVVIEINPNANVMVDTLFNQATAHGVSDDVDEFPAYDLSDHGNDPEGTNNDYDGMGTKMDPTPLNLSDLNVTKQVVGISAPTSGIVGNANVEFELKIKNKGNENINSISLLDDLQSQLGDAFQFVVPVDSLGFDNPRIVGTSALHTPTLNPVFTGIAPDHNLFNEDGELRPNDTVAIRFIIEVDPNVVDENDDGMADVLFNQALVSGKDPRGGIIADLSDSGSNPESNNPDAPNDSGMMDDATPVEIPVLNVAKAAIELMGPASNESGHLDVVFNLVIQNTGNVTIKEIELADTMDLDDHLGPAYVGLSAGSSPLIIESSALEDPVVNPGYDGFESGDADIFDGMTGRLAPGQSITIEIIAEIDPSMAIDPEKLFNQAEASGIGISRYLINDSEGLTVDRPVGSVTDGSDEGMMPESDNGDAGSNTPTLIVPCFSDGQVSCIGDVNISLDANCKALITPSQLSNPIQPWCDEYYMLQLFDAHGMELDTNIVDGSYYGQTLKYVITEPEAGQTCWGYIYLEDKFPPVIACENDTVTCIELIHDYRPEIIGECGTVDFTIVDLGFEEICGDPLLKGFYTKQYIATDQAGNDSEPCVQVIYLERVNVEEKIVNGGIIIPGEITLDCDVSNLFNEEGYVSTALSGVPTWSGASLVNEDIWSMCNLGVEYDDLLLLDIGCKKKYVRTWRFFEWVCGDIIEPVTRVQFINVVDDKAPQLEIGQDTIRVSVDQLACEAFVPLPPAALYDNCQDAEDIEVFIIHPTGNIFDNGGGALFDYGISEVVYVAEDRCHNQSRDTVHVVVTDNIPPVAICLENLVVSIDDQEVRVAAQEFDQGSYNPCGLDRIEVRRMEAPCDSTDLVLGEYIHFCCDDAGKQIPVVMRVTDKSGNWNECMVMVNVQDKSPATVHCLPDITVTCDFNYGPLSTFGWIRSEHEQGDIDIHPEFLVTSSGDLRDGVYFDNCGATVTELPEEDNRNQCGVGEIIRSLVVTDASGLETICRQVITFVGDELKEPLYWIYFPPDEEVVGCLNEEALSPVNTGEPVVSDGGCSQVGISREDTYYEKEEGSEHCILIERHWSVIDWCRSGSKIVLEDIQRITVMDDSAPVITGGCDPIQLDAGSMCEEVEFRIATSAVDCTPSDKLKWTYVLRNDSGEILDEGIPSRKDGGVDVRIRQGEGEYKLTWKVTDLCGNIDSCEQLIAIVCSQIVSEEAHIDGYVRTWRGESMNDVKVYMADNDGKGEDSPYDMTDEVGEYGFSNMPTGESYVIDPDKNDDVLNGLSVVDILKLQRLILGIDEITDPQLLLAADVNGDGKVSSFDLVVLRRVLLGLVDEFETNDSWRFYWENESLDFLSMTQVSGLKETYILDPLEEDMEIGFVGVKVGDLTGDAIGNTVNAGHSRSFEEEHLTYEVVESGSHIHIVVRNQEDLHIEGLQATWKWSGPDFAGLVSQELSLQSDQWHFDRDRHTLTMIWTNVEGQHFKAGSHLFSLQLEAGGVDTDEFKLELDDERISPAAYSAGKTHYLDLSRIESANEFMIVDQNIPNPWTTETAVKYWLPQSGEVVVRVYDMINRLIYERVFSQESGHQVWTLKDEEIKLPGIYLYEMNYQDQVIRKKMIRVK